MASEPQTSGPPPKKVYYVPKPKHERGNRKGWAEGYRERYFEPWLARFSQIAGNAQAVDDFFDELFRDYFTKIHWTVPDHEEPPFPVNQWRDDVVMPTDALTDGEMVAKRAIVEEKKKAIRRWFQYRHQHVPSARSAGLSHGNILESPYAIVWARISGTLKPPKARQACQEWQVAHREEIQQIIKERWDDLKRRGLAKPKQGPDFRNNVARELFGKLSDSDKKEWGERAKSVAVTAKADFERVVKSPPSTDPVVRARCIANLPSFLQPIAEMVGAITGLQLIVHAAGPMPQYNGEVSVITVSSGKNLETLPTTVTNWKPKKFRKYKEYLVDFVHTCYTDEQLEAAKLPSNAGGLATGCPDNMDYDLSSMLFPIQGDEEDEDEDDDEDVDEDGISQASDHSEDTSASQSATNRKRPRSSKADVGRAKKKRATGTKPDGDKTAQRAVKALPRQALSKIGNTLSGQPGNEPDDTSRSAQNAFPSSSAPPPTSQSDHSVLPSRDSVTPPPPSQSSHSLNSSRESTPDIEQPDKTSSKSAKATRQPTYEERRAANIAAIKLMPEYIAAFGAAQDLNASLAKKTVVRKRKTDGQSGPPRRSTRLHGGDTNIENVNGGVGDASGNGDVDGNGGDGNGDVNGNGGDGDGGDTSAGGDVDGGDVSGGGDVDGGDASGGGRDNVEDMVMQDVLPHGAKPSPCDYSDDDEERAEEVAEGLVDAPDWFSVPYAFFEDAVRILGPRWRKLLDHFVLLESEEDYKKRGELAGDGRPSMLSKWVKDGRLTRKKDMPSTLTTVNLPMFKQQFTTWYDSLQPDWREKNEDGWVRPKLGRKRQDWGGLEVRGVCGALSIVACVYWWGLVAAQMDQSDFDEWERAVDEVSWMLEKNRVN